MTDRLRWKLGAGRRDHIIKAVMDAPEGKIVEIRDETRSDAQNRLMWPLLTDISTQCDYYGRKLPPDEWKNGVMLALNSMERQTPDFLPGLVPGTIWPRGLSTSALTKVRFSELIDLIYYVGAERGVKFRTDKETTRKRAAAEGLI